MSWKDFVRKITSRKFWIAVAGFVTCLILAFNGDAETAQTITACIMAGATVIGYLFAEGLTDASRANTNNYDEPVDEDKEDE